MAQTGVTEWLNFLSLLKEQSLPVSGQRARSLYKFVWLTRPTRRRTGRATGMLEIPICQFGLGLFGVWWGENSRAFYIGQNKSILFRTNLQPYEWLPEKVHMVKQHKRNSELELQPGTRTVRQSQPESCSWSTEEWMEILTLLITLSLFCLAQSHLYE